MLEPLVSFQIPAVAPVVHLAVDFGDFSATDVEFTPVSERAKAVFAEMFGPCVSSVRIRKSRSGEFNEEFLVRCEAN